MSLPRPFLDIEASGFGAGSYPIEIGLVLADGSSYCTLITPLSEWTHWDESAEKIHGITRAILQQHGKSVVEVANAINSQLSGQTVYTDSWYHDYTWLSRLFDAADSSPRFRLEDLRMVLPDAGAAQWERIKQDVIAELKLSRHRASNDARILQATLLRVSPP